MTGKEINQILISGYPNADVKERIEINKSNFPFAYSREWKCIKNGSFEPGLQPQVFNYHVAGSHGVDLERTNIVCENQYANIDTYSKDVSKWSSLTIAEKTPQGIIEANIHMNSMCEAHIEFNWFSNERFAENNIDVTKTHPMTVARKNPFTPLTILKTTLPYIPPQEAQKLISKLPHIGLNNLYEELKKEEEQKNAETQEHVAKR